MPALHADVAPAGGGVNWSSHEPTSLGGGWLSRMPSQSLSMPSHPSTGLPLASTCGSTLPTQLSAPFVHVMWPCWQGAHGAPLHAFGAAPHSAPASVGLSSVWPLQSSSLPLQISGSWPGITTFGPWHT